MFITVFQLSRVVPALIRGVAIGLCVPVNRNSPAQLSPGCVVSGSVLFGCESE